MKSCGSGPCHDSEWMKSPAHRVLTQYIRIMKLHRSILEQRLNKTGVYRSQHQILTAMAEHPNTSQKELAEYLNRQKAVGVPQTAGLWNVCRNSLFGSSDG